ncbi:penicillin-binding protein activator [Xenorhabdus griffiniae]|uniref:Penicillin-binding protein activator n=1 Tax=Xenorhabdus griffiniae TaxID=351672 RepID=A0ABY9XJE3_9GAMM|nr:penicillin-binding protein activator [Xenorhabdus griffiniae]MBD1226787.1 penicillin-binding protein activator [Xenorhabdus griffiniae]MBE8586792.1 penicillin-binding protein activator [Xenorhabdus griffiniae]WMV72955.1 penicillin-binding protein activator [Xenorhabdus griffiniae]WNH02634.1 penicillin-binding protein activator [Xenorhabdus griffiniae]
MLPSIFVRLKTGLIYTALLSTIIIAGCTMPEQQGQPTSKPQDKISAEINRYQAIIDAAHNQPSLDVIRAYIALESFATDEAARQKNFDETWQLLTQLSPQQMNELVINANEYTLQGWLDLLNTYQTNKQDLDKLRLAIHDWQIRYPNNPAAHSLPTALQHMLQETENSHATIGLFLPLSGQAKIFGDATRQGFLDAQKGLPESPSPTNTTDPNGTVNAEPSTSPENTSAVNSGNADPATPEPKMGMIDSAPTNDQTVKIYDTNSQPLTELLEQAKQDGVTLVVGPLLKPNVEQLAQIETPLNILALNEPDMPQGRPNMCYFSLSPEDEAKNAAMHIWQQQKRSPLVLIPRTNLGTRVAQAFAQEWQKLGGQTVLQQSFGTPTEMKQSMNRGIGIRLSGTPVISTNSATDPVDAVYIVATANELTMIKPMIDMAISSRKKPALYASSRSNKAGSGPDFRLEMDGMQFSDIPLLTGVNVPLMQQAAKKFTNDYSLMRLYAMGIDAWSLANQFTQMQQEMGFHLSGASGELSVLNNCTILRQLPWMQFNNGRIILENTNSTEGIDNAGNTHNIESTDSTVQGDHPGSE